MPGSRPGATLTVVSSQSIVLLSWGASAISTSLSGVTARPVEVGWTPSILSSPVDHAGVEVSSMPSMESMVRDGKERERKVVGSYAGRAISKA